MVNVAALSMAMARSLDLDGPMLREFGFAALMHDIGKVHTPLEILNKPDKLTEEEFKIMKQHVVDGAHVLRRTPETPALAPVVAFEHHLKQDLSGYPENIGSRKLNLCTMVVSVVDVFDALRSNRAYRAGLATDRIKHIMGQQDGTAFNRTLLRRFVNLMGLFPIGTLVRLNTDEIGVVTQTHPDDPFRPQVKLIIDRKGEKLETPAPDQHLGPRRARRVPAGSGRGRGRPAGRHRPARLFIMTTQAQRYAHDMAAPQAPPEPLSPELAGRLAEFAKACKAATRIVSMYPVDTSGDSGGARPHRRGRQAGDRRRSVRDHRAARRAADRRTRLRQARIRRSSNWPTLLHQQLIGELTLLDRLDNDGWHAFLSLLAKTPEDARAIGGVAKAWEATGNKAIALTEIDYAEVLRERAGSGESATWDRILAALKEDDEEHGGDGRRLDGRA